MSKGWVWLHNMAKPHYIGDDDRSLCGKWLSFSTEAEESLFTNAEHCKACLKKWEKLPEAPVADKKEE